MISASNQQGVIVRTERGLTIAGTRVSLYDVIDFLKAQYPPKLIRNKLNLTEVEINGALSYIETNRTEVESEYQQVLKTREEIRQYWEEYNRDRFDRIAKTPRKPEHEALWAELEAQRARRVAEQR